MEDNKTSPGMADAGSGELEAGTSKYGERFDKFSKSKSGKAIVDFVLFRTNLLPCTLPILYLVLVAIAWGFGFVCIVNAGPFSSLDARAVLNGIALIVAAPFAVHYLLELVKYVFLKVFVPLWEKIVLRFLVNVLPELLPFLFERFMKFIDIVLDGLVAATMVVAAVLKGVVWLPKTLCRRLGRWAETPLDGEAGK